MAGCSNVLKWPENNILARRQTLQTIWLFGRQPGGKLHQARPPQKKICLKTLQRSTWNTGEFFSGAMFHVEHC